MSNPACWTRRLIVPAIVLPLLSACATAGSEAPAVVCPPVVPYDQVTLDRAAADLDALPAGSPLITMMADYAVMRDQARACARPESQ